MNLVYVCQYKSEIILRRIGCRNHNDEACADMSKLLSPKKQMHRTQNNKIAKVLFITANSKYRMNMWLRSFSKLSEVITFRRRLQMKSKMNKKNNKPDKFAFLTGVFLNLEFFDKLLNFYNVSHNFIHF